MLLANTVDAAERQRGRPSSPERPARSIVRRARFVVCFASSWRQSASLALAASVCSRAPTAGDDHRRASPRPRENGRRRLAAKKVFKQDETDIKVGVGETFGHPPAGEPRRSATAGSWSAEPDELVRKADGQLVQGRVPTPSRALAPGSMEFKFKAKEAGTATVTFDAAA